MKTYRFLLVALIATVVFSACNNEQFEKPVKEGQEVSFRLQGGMPDATTRSLATTIDNLEAFVVFGTDDIVASPGLLFDGVTVARQLGGATFTYAPKVYYSVDATIAGFYAFSPVSAKINGSVTVPATILTDGISFDYTVPSPDDSGEVVQEDLLVAGTEVTSITTAPVSLNFKHALSRIFVTAQNTKDDPVIIKELVLMNLNTTGTLSVGPASVLDWSSLTTLDNYAYVLAPSGVVVPGGTSDKTLVTSMEQGMMILPQEVVTTGTGDVTADDFALKVTYNFANLSDMEQYVYINDGYEFEAGKQYKINITFDGLLPIEFEITVDDFEAPVEVDYP